MDHFLSYTYVVDMHEYASIVNQLCGVSGTLHDVQIQSNPAHLFC